MQYISKKDLGFDKEQILIVENFAGGGSKSVQLIDCVRQATSKIPSVFSVSGASVTVNKPVMAFGLNINGERVRVNLNSGDEYYLPTLGINLLEIRNFSSSSKLDQEGIIINETLANIMGRDSTGKVNSLMSSQYKYQYIWRQA